MTDKVPTEAAIWLARIERGLQPHEGVQLREWLESQRHRDAIVTAAKLHHGPDVVAVLAELVPVGFGNPAPVPKNSSLFSRLVAIVCIGLVAGGLPYLAIRHAARHPPLPGTLAPDEQLYSTGARETRTIRLPDSSHVILNGQSRLYLFFVSPIRDATVARGEAIFDVASKWPRQMTVLAGGRHFDAAGGRFDLRVIGPKSVELTVLDGSVTVEGLPYRRPATAQEAREFDPSVFTDATVGPMQAAVIDNGTLTRHAITAADLRSELGWEPEQVIYVTP